MKIGSGTAALIAAACLFAVVGFANAWEQGSAGQQGSSPGGPESMSDQSSMSEQQSGAGGQSMSMHDPKTIKDVQQKLNNEGYKAGPANGKWSKKSQQAMTKFQKDNNLQATGQINEESLVQLGLMPSPSGSAGGGSEQQSGAGGQEDMSSQESTTYGQGGAGGMSSEGSTTYEQGGAGGQSNQQQSGSY